MSRPKAMVAPLGLRHRHDILQSIEALRPTRRNFLLALTGMGLVGCGGGGGSDQADVPAAPAPAPAPQPSVPKPPPSSAPAPEPAPMPPPAPEPAPPPVNITAEILLDAPMFDNLLTYGGGPLEFARGSTATYIAANGLLSGVEPDQPRFAYDSYGQSYGVLIEQPDTQLLLQSQSFDSGVWSTSNISIKSGVGQASDGTNRLWQLSEGTSSGTHGISQTVAAAKSGADYTVNAVVKKSSARFVALQLATRAGNFHVARFDLSTGTGVSSFNSLDYGVNQLANGFVHLWAAFNTESGSAAPVVSLQMLEGGGVMFSYAGQGNAVLVSEMWLNAGRRPTSYLPSGSQPASRAGDLLSVATDGNFSANDCSGVFAFKYTGATAAGSTLWYTGIDSNNCARIRVTSSKIIFEKLANGYATACSHNMGWKVGRVYRVGWRISRYTGMELVIDGKTIAQLATVNAKRDIDLGSSVYIGSDGGASFCNCPISNLMVFGEA